MAHELQFGVGLDLGTRYSNVAVYERSPPAGSEAVTMMRDIPAVKDEHREFDRQTSADVVTEVFWKPSKRPTKGWGWQARDEALDARELNYLFDNLKYDLIREMANREKGKLKGYRDRLVYFLTSLLTHAKAYFKFFVLTVPTKFDEEKADFILSCLLKAIRTSQIFPAGHTLASENGRIIIVDEAEAAAEHYFETVSAIEVNDPILIADIGGGTADMLFGRVLTAKPRRWQRVSAASTAAGSCRLDDGFISFVRQQLVNRGWKDEDALAQARQFCRDRFESHKRSMKLEHLERAIHRSPMVVTVPTMNGPASIPFKGQERAGVFLPIFKELLQAMIDVIDEGAEDHAIDGKNLRVMLVGGFSQSQALREFLQRELPRHYAKQGFTIEMVLHHEDPYAVVKGGLTRAANIRVSSGAEAFAVSYGRPCWMSSDHEWAEKVPDSDIQNDDLWHEEPDGKRYMRIIEWFWLKGDPKPSNGTHVIPNIQHQVRPRDDGSFIIKEPIMIARRRMVSFLPFDAPENMQYAKECFSVQWDAGAWVNSEMLTRYYEATDEPVPRGVDTDRATYLLAEYNVEITIRGLGITAVAYCINDDGERGDRITAEVMRVAAPMTSAS